MTLKKIREYLSLLDQYNKENQALIKEEVDKYNALLKTCDDEIKGYEDKIQKNNNTIKDCKNMIRDQLTFDYLNTTYNKDKILFDEINCQPVKGKAKLEPIDKIKAKILTNANDNKKIKEKNIQAVLNKKNVLESELKTYKKQLNDDTINKLSSTIKITQKAYEETKNTYASDFSNISSPISTNEIKKQIIIGNWDCENNEDLINISNDSILHSPIELDIKEKGNILLNIDSQTDSFSSELENQMLGLAMKYLESFPSGSLKVGVFSSFFSSLQKLNAFYSSLLKAGQTINNEPCTNQQQFSMMLSLVKQRANIINNKLLDSNCSDLFELYDKSIKTESFQLIIIHDVIRDLSEENLKELYGCISGLYRCGIRFIIFDDFNEEIYKNRSPIYRSTVKEIYNSCVSFKYLNKAIFDEKAKINLVKLTNDTTIQSVFIFTNTYCENLNANKSKSLSYDDIGFGNIKKTEDNYESVIIPVGLNEPNTWQIELNCVGKSPIANLIIGIPGTGKSTLIDSMIMNGAMKYSPDELIFQLLDFKDGISSSVYTMKECRIPHIKVVSQNNKPEDAEIILSNILLESERRNKEYKALEHEIGKAIRNIAEYNRVVKDPIHKRTNMPRLIIVIDECQYLFEDENLAKKCEDIVRKCRSQGIHLILATQTMSRKMWNTIKFVDGRYCFEITKDDAEQLLSRKYAQLVSTEVPKGSYMAFASNNSGVDCEKIRIAYDGGDTSKYSKQIRDKWNTYPIDLVTIGDTSPLVISNNDYKKKDNTSEIAIGENFVDHQAFAIDFQNSRPVVLAGTHQLVQDSIITSMVLHLINNNINTYVIDSSRTQNIYECFSNNKQIHVANEKEYLTYLKQVHDIYDKRKTDMHKEYEPVVFIINAIQNIVDLLTNKLLVEETKPLTSTDTEFSFDAFRSSLTKKETKGKTIYGLDSLFNLINNAYKVNILICLSFDTISLTNDAGDQVLGYQQKNLLRLAKYKVLHNKYVADVKGIMEDTFKDKMLNGLSDNMAFVSVDQLTYYKIRYYQYDKNEIKNSYKG